MADIKNWIFLPIRLVFSHETVNRLGLRSLRDERYAVIKKHVKGRLIDIGCGNNGLVKEYGNNSVGVDVYDFGGDALIVEDTSKLPFENKAFNTASFVACLNHIINREEVIAEVNRILSDDGRVCLTMLTPKIGTLRHKLAWWDPDQNDRGIKEGEELGLSHEYIINLFENAGFRLVIQDSFVLGLNNIYVFQKQSLN